MSDRGSATGRPGGRPVARAIRIPAPGACAVLAALASLLSGVASALSVSTPSRLDTWYLVDDPDSVFIATAKVGSGCSGAPISRRLVLTAAHCGPDGQVVGVQTRQVHAMADALERRNLEVDFPRSYFGTLHHHPDYAATGNPKDANDIAVIELSVPLPVWHHVFTIYPHATPPFGAVVNTAGYGIFGTGEDGYCRPGPAGSCVPIFHLGGVLRSGYNTLESYGVVPNTVTTDFDAPPDAGWQGNPYGGRDPVSTVDPKGDTTYLETMTSRGDSGGPLTYNPALSLGFRRDSLPAGTTVKAVPNEHYLLGVVSYGADTSFEWGAGRCEGWLNILSLGTCTTPTKYGENLLGTYGDNDAFTLVYPYLDWIRGFGAVRTTAFKTQDELVDAPVERLTRDLHASHVVDGAIVGPTMLTPPPNSIHADPTSLEFTWRSPDPSVTEWRLHVGSTPGGADLFDSRPIVGEPGAVTGTEMLGVPIDGRRLYARLWYRDADGRMARVDSVYRTYDAPRHFVPELVPPGADGVLDGDSVTFRLEDHGYRARAHWLEIENASDGAILYSSGNRLGGVDELSVDGLPTDGRGLIATLYYGRGNGVYFGNARRYRLKAFDDDGVPPGTPGFDDPGTAFASTAELVGWFDNDWGADDYWLYVGSAPGARDYHDSGRLGTATSEHVPGLPVLGETVHARLFFRRDGEAWGRVDAAFTATADGGDPPGIVAPGSFSVLADTAVDVEWSDRGTPVSAWRVTAGTAPGESNLFDGGEIAAQARTVRVSGLPDDGSPVYVRLAFRDALGRWDHVDAAYTAATAGPAPSFSAPAAGDRLANGAQRFEWTSNGRAVDQWWLYLGSSPGARDLHDSGSLGTSTEATVDGLPADGRTVHARLFHRETNGAWRFVDSSYLSAAPVAMPGFVSPDPDDAAPIGPSQRFEWEDPAGTVTQWWLYVGAGRGQRQYLDSGNLGTATVRQVTGLPADGGTFWARLWYRETPAAPWRYLDRSWTSSGGTPRLVSPIPGQALTDPNAAFEWVDPSGDALEWWIYIGSAPGGREHENSGSLGTALEYAPRLDLPADGLPVYVRLWYRTERGGWLHVDAEYAGRS